MKIEDLKDEELKKYHEDGLKELDKVDAQLYRLSNARPEIIQRISLLKQELEKRNENNN